MYGLDSSTRKRRPWKPSNTRKKTFSRPYIPYIASFKLSLNKAIRWMLRLPPNLHPNTWQHQRPSVSKRCSSSRRPDEYRAFSTVYSGCSEVHRSCCSRTRPRFWANKVGAQVLLVGTYSGRTCKKGPPHSSRCFVATNQPPSTTERDSTRQEDHLPPQHFRTSSTTSASPSLGVSGFLILRVAKYRGYTSFEDLTWSCWIHNGIRNPYTLTL